MPYKTYASPSLSRSDVRVFYEISLWTVSRTAEFLVSDSGEREYRPYHPRVWIWRMPDARIFASHNFTRHFPGREPTAPPRRRYPAPPAFYAGRDIKYIYRAFLPLPWNTPPAYLRWKCLQTRNRRRARGRLGVVRLPTRFATHDARRHSAYRRNKSSS